MTTVVWITVKLFPLMDHVRDLFFHGTFQWTRVCDMIHAASEGPGFIPQETENEEE